MREIPTIEEPVPVLDLNPEEIEQLTDEVRALAAELGAVILAHNYQVPEIQDLADFVGDSLGLSRQAAATDAELIVFCGVHFMAETASILAPDKTVLTPDLDAGCSLAESITAAELRNWKQRYPAAGSRTSNNERWTCPSRSKRFGQSTPSRRSPACACAPPAMRSRLSQPSSPSRRARSPGCVDILGSAAALAARQIADREASPAKWRQISVRCPVETCLI